MAEPSRAPRAAVPLPTPTVPDLLRGWVDPAAWLANPSLKILSLVLALATWLYVQAGESTDERLAVPLAWVLPTDLVNTEPLPSLAYVTVRGTRAAVNKFRSEPLEMVIDLSTYEPGPHTVELDPVPLDGLPQTIERLSTAPQTVEVSLEPAVERNVEVSPIQVGDPATGHAVISLMPEPRYVKVRGPRSVLASLKEVPTNPIDVTELAEDVTVDVALDLPPGVAPTEPVEVHTRITVSSRTEKRTVPGVPVYVWGATGWRVEPGELAVTVEGPAGRVAALQRPELAAFVYLPASPSGDRYEVSFVAGDGFEPRIAVLEMSGSGIVPVGTEPSTVVVTRE